MKHALLESLPPVTDPVDWNALVERVRRSGRKVVVLDDDPTGTQTMHGIPVLTEWSIDALAAALSETTPCFYVLTNSRALKGDAAVALNREIARNLNVAAARTKVSFTVVSRSDSTLRGHFPAEVDALVETLRESIDNILVIPAFFEGGRYTVNNVHFVADGERWVPAAETEFARDATFGYRESNLARWVEEKSAGRIRAAEVGHIDIAALRRSDGVGAVKERLLAQPRGRVITVDAVEYADLEVFVMGLLEAEAAGRRYLARSAAGFVRVRAGISPRPLLRAEEIVSPNAGAGGLIMVGSYVAKTTRQLESALRARDVSPAEIRVDELFDAKRLEAEIERVAAMANAAIVAGQNALLYTSRTLVSAVGRAGELDTAQIVSAALVAIARRIVQRPRFFIAKGGITSSDLATKGLGVRQAFVLGQVAAGIPVWRLGPESRFPEMSYVVFPGNVGGPETLRELIERLAV